jgi:hypothetical protein
MRMGGADMVTLWSALAFGCLVLVRLRHAGPTAVPAVGQHGAGGGVPGYDLPAARGVRIRAEVRCDPAVTTVTHTQINLARGPSRDPSPA